MRIIISPIHRISDYNNISKSSLTNLGVIEVEVNTQCNRSCSYCPVSRIPRLETGEMGINVYHCLLHQLQAIRFRGAQTFHWYSEPLIFKKLSLYVQLSKKYLPDCRRIIYSNGDYLTIKKIESLIQDGITGFVVTQHEAPPRTFQNIYKKLPYELREKIIYRDFSEMTLTSRTGLISSHISDNNENQPCNNPSRHIVCSTHGNVIPCTEDFRQINQMGNILHTSLVDIWNNEKYIKFRRELSKGNRKISKACMNCNAFDYVNSPFKKANVLNLNKHVKFNGQNKIKLP